MKGHYNATRLASAMVAWICFGQLASAHHSVAQYDLTTAARKTIAGTVKKFDWENPHSWLWIEVPKDDGSSTPWGIEMSSPGALRKSGFAWDAVKAGEKVIIEIAPIKDGRNAGQLIKLTYEDGHVWQPTGQASPLPPPGQSAPGQSGAVESAAQPGSAPK